jgi:hypothetical protein
MKIEVKLLAVLSSCVGLVIGCSAGDGSNPTNRGQTGNTPPPGGSFGNPATGGIRGASATGTGGAGAGTFVPPGSGGLIGATGTGAAGIGTGTGGLGVGFGGLLGAGGATNASGAGGVGTDGGLPAKCVNLICYDGFDCQSVSPFHPQENVECGFTQCVSPPGVFGGVCAR